MDDNSTKIGTTLPSGDKKSAIDTIVNAAKTQSSDGEKSAETLGSQLSTGSENAANSGDTTIDVNCENIDACGTPLGGESDANGDITMQEFDAPKPTPSNLDDLEADKNFISYEERVQTAMENNPIQPCSRDAKTDEKISKYSTYGCIPFFIAGIIVTLFDKAKYRSPWSFLLIGLAVCVLAVGAFMRYSNTKKCKCSVCETQAKTLRSSAILWGLLAIACMIGFVVFLIINKGV